MNRYKTRYFKEIESIKDFLDQGYNLENCVIQEVDFTSLPINWKSLNIKGTCFLGCSFTPDDLNYVIQKALVFPTPKHIPYMPYRKHLYDWRELAEEIDGVSNDLTIYNHFSKYRHHHDVVEMLYQRLHDHAIDDALYDLLNRNEEKKCIGMMGGHGTKRTHADFRMAARTSYMLSKAGYYIASGGGPGIMEAANLGAYMSSYDMTDLDHAMDIISGAPHYADDNFHELAVSVLSEYPNGQDSLAIPTWFYGHEPSNVFATSIAKYFSNSIREDTLLAISLHGVVYAPGSAGTTQEIFMDAAQNHYGTFGWISPMVFLGKHRYQEGTQLYRTLHSLAEGKTYQQYLHLTDDPDDALSFIIAHPPVVYE